MARSVLVTGHKSRGTFLNAFHLPEKTRKVASILDRAIAFKSARAQQVSPHSASDKANPQLESQGPNPASNAAKSRVVHQERSRQKSLGKPEANGLDRTKKVGSQKPEFQKPTFDTESSDEEPLMVKSNRKKLMQHYADKHKKTIFQTIQPLKNTTKRILSNDEDSSTVTPWKRKTKPSVRRVISDDDEDDEPYITIPKRRANRRIIHGDDSDDGAVLRATAQQTTHAAAASTKKFKEPVSKTTKKKEELRKNAKSRALAEKTRLDRQQERWNAVRIDDDRAAGEAEVAACEATSKMKWSTDPEEDESIPSKRMRNADQSAPDTAAKAQGHIDSTWKNASKVNNASATAVPLGFFANMTKNWSRTASSLVSSSVSGSAPKRKTNDEHNRDEPGPKRTKVVDSAEHNSLREFARTPRVYRQPRQSSHRGAVARPERRPLRPVQSRLVQGVVLEVGQTVESRDLEAARNFYRL